MMRREQAETQAAAENKRFHVCMVVHSHYSPGEPRGEREAHALVEAGYDVDVIALGSPAERALERSGGVRIVRLPVQHVRGTNALRSFLEYAGFALRATVEVVRVHRRAAIDVVYVHAPPDFLIVTALVPRLLGSRIVLDIHDLSPHMLEARFGRRRLARLAGDVLTLVERWACAVADRVITVHEPYRHELATNGVPADKVVLVMNVPDPADVELAQRRAADGLRPDSFRVAYHGTITHWYGVDLVVEAIALLAERIPGLEGLILGEGDALAEVEQLAHRLAVDRQIELSRRYVDHLEALRRVAAANCGVIPNRPSRLNRFALSSKLFEYVALGIPVVVARLETLAAHFASDEVTFFEPGDAKSLAEAIAWVAQHPLEAHEKAERAQRRAESYSWTANRARLLEAIAAVCL
jgi:glycosyltransferase involved in cell wall biosynthesis